MALAAHLAAEGDEESMLLVLAADHLITKVDNFHVAIQTAISFAENNQLVTFGIIPEHPETGYGYIKRGEHLSNACFKVDSFVEKPRLEKAVEYLASGDYSWNSGMFMFKTAKFLQELRQFSPEIFSTTQQSVSNSQRDMNFIRVGQDIFKHCPSDSIDYAVMEKTHDAVVIPIDAGWVTLVPGPHCGKCQRRIIWVMSTWVKLSRSIPMITRVPLSPRWWRPSGWKTWLWSTAVMLY